MTTYAEHDSVESLTEDQLALMSTSDHGLFIRFIKDRPNFDIHRIRLLLDLGVVEARRRLDVMRDEPQGGMAPDRDRGSS